MQRLNVAFSLHGVARRYLLASIACLVLVTQISTFAHLLVVRHVVCPQHGELVHADDEAPPSDGATLPSGENPRGSAVRTGRETNEDHVHCPVAMHRRQTSVVPAGMFTIAPARAAETAAFAFRSIPRPAPFALFRLAPKTSPPVV
jgi:hypothetical protein